MNDLTVIVVSHQSAQDLGDCLTSLFAFPPGPNDGVAKRSNRALVWLPRSQAPLAWAAFMLRWGRSSFHPSPDVRRTARARALGVLGLGPPR